MQKIVRKVIVIIAVSATIGISGCEKETETELASVSMEELEEEGVSGEEPETAQASIYVHVCGEVIHPGVYILDAGSRVYEAIEAAGGLTSLAAENALNQAEILEDGQQIQVLSLKALMDEEQKAGITSDGKVNLNKASVEELMTLSGIGESKAEAIIRHRKEKGDFSSIEEIMEIEGIKEGVFKRIEDQITVS